MLRRCSLLLHLKTNSVNRTLYIASKLFHCVSVKTSSALLSHDSPYTTFLKSTFGYLALKSFQPFASALSAILFASSDIHHANIFITFIVKMDVFTIIAD